MANKRIQGITIEIDGQTQKLSKALQDVNKRTINLQSELKDVERLLKLDPSNTQLVEQAQRKLSQAVETTSEKLDMLREAFKQAERQVERGELGQDKLDALQREIIQTENQLKGFQTRLSKIDDTNSINNVDKEFEKLQSTIKDTSNEVEDFSTEFGSQMSEIGQGLIDVGDKASEFGKKIIDGLKGAIEQSLTFDDAMRKLQAQTGASDKEMQNFSNSVEDIYRSGLGENIDEVAEAFARVQQQTMLSGDELSEFTELALEFGKVFDTDVNEATRSAQTLMYQFGLDSEEAFNLLTQGYRNGLNYSGEFLDTVNEYSVQFKQAGFEAEDMFNLMYDGAKSGAWQMSTVGDAVKEMYIKIQDGTAIDSIEKLGLSAEDVTRKFSEGGESARESFYEIFNELNKVEDSVERNEILAGLLGTKYEDLGIDASKSLGTMSDMFNRNIDSAEELDDVNEGLSGSFERLARGIEVAVSEIGKSLQPVLENIIPVIEDVVDGIVNFVKENPELVSTLTLIAGAVGGALVVFGGLVTTLGMLAISWGAITTVFSGVALAPIIGIISGIVAGIILLVGAIRENWDGISQALENFKTKFEESFGSAQGFFARVWEGMQQIYNNVIQPLFEAIGTLIEHVINFIAEIMPGLNTAFTIAWEIVMAVWNSIGQPIFDAIMSVVGWLIDWFGENYPFIAEVFNSVMDRIKTVWENFGVPLFDAIKQVVEYTINFLEPIIIGLGITFEVMWDMFRIAWDVTKPVIDWIVEVVSWFAGKVAEYCGNIAEFFSNAFQSISDAISWIGDRITEFTDWLTGIGDRVVEFFSGIDLYSMGVDMIQGLINGIKAKAGGVFSALGNLVGRAVGGAEEELEINSPSKVMEQIGLWTGEGFIVGLDKMTKSVAKAGQELADTSIPTINTPKINSSTANTLNANNQPSVVYLTNETYLDSKLISTETTKQVMSNMNRQSKNYRMSKGGLSYV